jgi:hypothetical protein
MGCGLSKSKGISKNRALCKIFTLLLTVCTVVKSKVKILQNFVAFSEYMNFKTNCRFFVATFCQRQRHSVNPLMITYDYSLWQNPILYPSLRIVIAQLTLMYKHLIIHTYMVTRTARTYLPISRK